MKTTFCHKRRVVQSHSVTRLVWTKVHKTDLKLPQQCLVDHSMACVIWIKSLFFKFVLHSWSYRSIVILNLNLRFYKIRNVVQIKKTILFISHRPYCGPLNITMQWGDNFHIYVSTGLVFLPLCISKFITFKIACKYGRLMWQAVNFLVFWVWEGL